MWKTMSIPWCKEERKFLIPEDSLIWVATPRHVDGVEDETAEIINAIRNPIASKTLPEILGPPKGKKIAIVVDDNTRVTPVEKVLPLLIDELNLAGVEDNQITVIIALGTHHFMSEEQIEKRVGKCYGRVKVINHDCDAAEELVNLGVTELGTPVIINKTFYESDVGICIGNIIPHFIAGWSGGAKIIQPGISGSQTTAQVHLNGSLDWPERIGNAETNIRCEMEAIARKAGLDFIINTVLNLDNEIVKVVAGDLVKAHRTGVRYARDIYQMRIPERADIVVAGTYPANKDLWQADKGLASAVMMVKPGGTVVWAAPCLEGVSPEHPILVELADTPPKKVYDMAVKGEIDDLVGSTGHIMIGVMREMAHIILVSDGVSKEEAERMGFEYAPDIDSGMHMALKREGNNAKIGILTHGADMAPVVC